MRQHSSASSLALDVTIRLMINDITSMYSRIPILDWLRRQCEGHDRVWWRCRHLSDQRPFLPHGRLQEADGPVLCVTGLGCSWQEKSISNEPFVPVPTELKSLFKRVPIDGHRCISLMIALRAEQEQQSFELASRQPSACRVKRRREKERTSKTSRKPAWCSRSFFCCP